MATTCWTKSGTWGSPNSPLMPVLKSLIRIGDRYIQIERENPFDYGEQANNSLLCAAAFNAGWVGLCEHPVDKKVKRSDQEEGSGKKTSSGRADLYLGDEEESYFLETKILWHNTSSSDWRKENAEKLQRAEEQVRSIKGYKFAHQYTGAFVVPIFVKSKPYDKGVIRERFDAIREMLEQEGFDHGAWIYTRYKRRKHVKIKFDSRRVEYRPGVLLGLKKKRAGS